MARSLIPSLFEPGTLSGAVNPLMQLHREMNRLFDDTLRGAPAAGSAIVAPRLNVSESEKEFRIEAELPGVAEKDVQIELTGDLLTLRGEKREEREDKAYHIVERSFGSFQRSIRLPFVAKPDSVSATFKDGVLSVVVPKAAAQDAIHRIQVRAAQPDAQAGSQNAAPDQKPGATPGKAA
ncbi:MAG TPA: Hsp20/alpha crystallin family protein [Acetobacteraceae bacterium]